MNRILKTLLSSLLPLRSSLFAPRSSLLALPSSLLALLLLPLATAEAAGNFPVGTYTVKGSVRDVANKVMDAESGVKVRAVNAQGTVLAEADVGKASASGTNFALMVPLSTKATDSTAAVGDELNVVFVNEKGVSVATQPIKARAANAVDALNFTYLDMTTVTSVDGAKSVQIPTEYLDGMQAYLDGLPAAEGGGKKYDPWGDYDGDGFSNYNEYLAGTNPFDASDALRVKRFAPGGAGHQITFEYVGGHLYGVAATPSLVKPSWATAKVKQTADGEEQNEILPPATNGEPGETTIYVVPTEGAKQGFFKLEAR